MKNFITFKQASLFFVISICLLGAVQAQQLTVSGTVTSADDGQPLPGTNITLKGTITGATTNAEGNYQLTVPSLSDTLVFSYIGFETLQIPIDGRNTINVTLQQATFGVGDELVVVGYGTVKKSALTGSISTVSSRELTQRPASNTTELLQGQISGLITRQSSGLPGEDRTILNIRGFGQPLVLVDGIERDMDQIDPNEIESISVLKDASAAIYGARAGNGVILVTTKRGADVISRISYHGSGSFSQPTYYAHQAGAREWAEMVYETGLNPDDFSPSHVHYNPDSNTLINKMNESIYEGYDWTKAVFRNWVPQQQHNLNTSGGSENIKYFASFGFTDQESNFRAGDFSFNRYNLRSNIDAIITDNLTVSADFSYHKTVLDKANFDVGSMFGAANHSKPVYPYKHEADPSRAAYAGYTQSAYFLTFKEYSGFIENRENAISGVLEIKYSIPFVNGLEAKARLNYEDIFFYDKNVAKPIEIWDYDQLEDEWMSTGIHRQNQMSVRSGRVNTFQPLVQLEYFNTLGGDHNIRGMIIGEIRTYDTSFLRGSRFDILSYEAPYLNYASDERKDNAEVATKQARTSVIGRFNYDYKDKYMLDLILRADASAEYPPEGRWGYFPSIGVGWNISDESFMKDNFSNLDFLKLRASHGKLGNDAISSFAYLTGFNIGSPYYVFGSSPIQGINSTGLANPNITWETMTISNIGFEGILWGGKLGFEIDAFYRLRENILAIPTSQVPNTFGANLPRTNLNKRDNRGFEIELTHTNNIRNFTYYFDPKISWSRGKFINLEEDVLPITADMDDATREFNRLFNERFVNAGQWDDRRWGLVSDGFFMSQEEIDNHSVDQDQNGNQTIIVGDIRYKDLNGDGIIDWRDEKVVGKSGLPNIMYSLNMGVQYKGLSIRMLWQGARDYTINFTGPAASPFQNESIPLKEHYKYRPIIGIDNEGNEFITNPDDFKLPRATQSGMTANNSRASDFWIFDAKYLRLKMLNISYALPQGFINFTGLNQSEIYLNGTNLFTLNNLGIWKNSFDPEIPTHNNRNYPPVKTITLGLRFTI